MTSSAIKVIMIMLPPDAKIPLMNRQAANIHMLTENAETMPTTAIPVTHGKMTDMRPKLSAIQERKKLPTALPMKYDDDAGMTIQ